MRKIAKYYQYEKLKGLLIKRYPKRILDLKRSKWKSIKSFILKSIKKKSRYYYHTFLKEKVRLNKWVYKKFFFAERCSLKRNLSRILGFKVGLNYKLMNKFNNKEKSIINFYTNNLFRLDRFICFFNFSKSIYEARQVISSGGIFINNKKAKSNYILKNGDCIDFLLKSEVTENLIKKTMISKGYIFSFFEYDFFNKKIYILKSDINLADLRILFQENFSLKYL